MKGYCWWAVPNGGRRTLGVARKMKAEGAKAGVPDITLIHNGKYYGIEVKKPKTGTPQGRLSKSQISMIKHIEDAGSKVGIVYSVLDVLNLLKSWKIE